MRLEPAVTAVADLLLLLTFANLLLAYWQNYLQFCEPFWAPASITSWWPKNTSDIIFAVIVIGLLWWDMQGAAVQRTLSVINIYRPLVLFIVTFSWIKENMIIALMTNMENSKYINPSKVLLNDKEIQFSR